MIAFLKCIMDNPDDGNSQLSTVIHNPDNDSYPSRICNDPDNGIYCMSRMPMYL